LHRDCPGHRVKPTEVRSTFRCQRILPRTTGTKDLPRSSTEFYKEFHGGKKKEEFSPRRGDRKERKENNEILPRTTRTEDSPRSDTEFYKEFHGGKKKEEFSPMRGDRKERKENNEIFPRTTRTEEERRKPRSDTEFYTEFHGGHGEKKKEEFSPRRGDRKKRKENNKILPRTTRTGGTSSPTAASVAANNLWFVTYLRWVILRKLVKKYPIPIPHIPFLYRGNYLSLTKNRN